MRRLKPKPTSVENRRRGTRRPRVTPIWRRRSASFAALGLVLVVAVSSGWWLWHDGWVARTADKLRWMAIAGGADVGLTVREIYVEGRVETPKKEILNSLRLERGAPILAFDAAAARRRIEELPWIRKASVERRLPDEIHLKLTERTPLALWQQDGQFALIDAEGKVILRDHLTRFSRLLVVVGKDAPSHAADLISALGAHPELARRVRAAVRVGGRRWDLYLDNRVKVRLPEGNPSAAWSRLARLEDEHHLLARDVATIDLRLPDRVIVRPDKQIDAKPKPGERQT
jgi:cell division protein FtsQ